MNVMSKKIIRYLAVFMAVSILFSGISLQITTAFADEVDGTVETPTDIESIVSDDSDLQDYVAYTKGHKDANKATVDVTVPLNAYAAEDNAVITAGDNKLIWEEGTGKITWTFDVTQEAVYNLQISWDALAKGIDPEFEILIDGVCPFDEAENIVLSRMWKKWTKL